MSPPFLRAEATGALAPEFERALDDRQVRSAVVNALLHMEFPETLHEEILRDVNLGHLVAAEQSARDPRFKSTVLRAYEDRCSFCGYDLRLGGSPVGIDAAHVQMRSKGGPDRIGQDAADQVADRDHLEGERKQRRHPPPHMGRHRGHDHGLDRVHPQWR